MDEGHGDGVQDVGLAGTVGLREPRLVVNAVAEGFDHILMELGQRLHGLAFNGDDHPDNIATIAAFSGARVLGRLPSLKPLTPESLAAATRAAFRAEDFA